jgi:D-alanine-D-alanine ligase
MGLVPSTCEALGAPYFGADAYAKFLCQDKFLSRIFARDAGFEVADGFLLRPGSPPSPATWFEGRKVVKPNSEGTSIGVRLFGPGDAVAARAYAVDLMRSLDQEVLVESFTPGREVMLCMYGPREEPNFLGASEVFFKEEPDYFKDNIFDVDLKKDRSGNAGFSTRDITSEIPEEVVALAKNCYTSMGKLDYLRIDGRLLEDRFCFIEFSPLPFLGPWGALATLLRSQQRDLAFIAREFVALAAR